MSSQSLRSHKELGDVWKLTPWSQTLLALPLREGYLKVLSWKLNRVYVAMLYLEKSHQRIVLYWKVWAVVYFINTVVNGNRENCKLINVTTDTLIFIRLLSVWLSKKNSKTTNIYKKQSQDHRKMIFWKLSFSFFWITRDFPK